MRKYQLVVIVRLSGRRYFCSRKFCKGNKYEIKDNSSDNHCLDCRRYVGRRKSWPKAYAAADTSARQESKWTKAFSRLTVGGYGEAVGTYNFYSDNVFRYQFPDSYRDSKGHARFDLPHVVIMLGYDFGKGWTLGTEIEFEHGGVEAAVEMENEEAGEFEREIERGGEVALEQFWIQKEFMPELNLRMGHIVVAGRCDQ